MHGGRDGEIPEIHTGALNLYLWGSQSMAERPKTVGLMQDVFAADGDMAQVPVP